MVFGFVWSVFDFRFWNIRVAVEFCFCGESFFFRDGIVIRLGKFRSL